MTEQIVYGYGDGAPTSDSYLLPVLSKLLERKNSHKVPMFEIGAGNGSTTKFLQDAGYKIQGVELSADGVRLASELGVHIDGGAAYDDLAAQYGQFKITYALEVIEHLYVPRLFTKCAYDLLLPDGVLIVSTPFHGYWENLSLAATNKLDKHFTALWDHGHIKFWLKATLRSLLEECGFWGVTFSYAGRRYPFSKSFFACARKPD